MDRSARFLGRYVDPLPICSRGGFHVIAARRDDDGRPCVVVVPGASSDRGRALDAFAEAARIQNLIDHPRVPRVTAWGDSPASPYLEYDCDAVTDATAVIQLIADSRQKVPYAAADAFIAGIRRAMEAAHALVDPRTGVPLCLGRLSSGNVLFNARGAWFLIGYGRNVAVERDDGSPDGTITFLQAPELSTGGAPSPSGDYVALVLFMRTMMPYVEPAPELARILRGEIEEGDHALLECLRWVEFQMVGGLPTLRPSVAEAVEVADRIRAMLRVTVDPEGFAAFVAGLIQRAETPTTMEEREPVAPLTLTLGPDTLWVAGSDGVRHRLGRAHRRIVLALVARRDAAVGAALTVWELLEAGWPGERPLPEAGSNRVYVALTRLRAMGLRDVVERFDDGYRLCPQAVVRHAQ
jgi:hypothetical protein